MIKVKNFKYYSILFKFKNTVFDKAKISAILFYNINIRAIEYIIPNFKIVLIKSK